MKMWATYYLHNQAQIKQAFIGSLVGAVAKPLIGMAGRAIMPAVKTVGKAIASPAIKAVGKEVGSQALQSGVSNALSNSKSEDN
jgi:hypothetical protein